LVAIKTLVMLGTRKMNAIREMENGGMVDHPSVVKFYDADLTRGVIVMEYLAGGNLATKLKEDPLWVKENFTQIFVDIGEALRAAHLQRMVHRDIKPENILLTAEGRAKLADFGLARIIDDNGAAWSRAGSTPYMAPEVLFGEGYGLDADIHSLGCVMYEAWTGALPFEKPGHAKAIALQKQQGAGLRSVKQLDTNVDDILNELLKGMLAPREERIKSIEVVLEQLRHRDPASYLANSSNIDNLQHIVGAIYGLRNRNRSPVLLLGHFHVALRMIVGGLRDHSKYGDKRVEAALPRAFAWLCSLASSVNARLSQLLWLKFDGVCPYCDQIYCECPSLDRKKDPERNNDLLNKMHDRRLISAPPPQSFMHYQAMFRRMYGEVNAKSNTGEIGLHAHSEVAEAMDALLQLTSLDESRQVTVLYLELSDLVAWFYALLNSYRRDYSFVDSFVKLFAHGCYACKRSSCECPTIESEIRLANWREF
jgi:serine/threonine protein kinase